MKKKIAFPLVLLLTALLLFTPVFSAAEEIHSASIVGTDISWVQCDGMGCTFLVGIENCNGVIPSGSKMHVQYFDTALEEEIYKEIVATKPQRTKPANGLYLDVAIEYPTGEILHEIPVGVRLYVEIGTSLTTEEVTDMFFYQGAAPTPKLTKTKEFIEDSVREFICAEYEKDLSGNSTKKQAGDPTVWIVLTIVEGAVLLALLGLAIWRYVQKQQRRKGRRRK